MKYIVLFFTLSICACNNTLKKDHKHEYLRHVGDIPFDNTLDDPAFRPCNEESARVHHNFNNPDLYEGEKPAMIKPLMQLEFAKIEGESGYITIRFMVNCEGKTGRYRVEQLDFEYKDKKFNEKIIDSLLSKTKSLDKWIPAKSEDFVYDYYKYLTFKIIDNQIKDILP
ncbi:MAG: hypothetical protein HOP11_04465 [Saprospiraceae bacterium]|nr:hypothetical protein [Saprospiraceae bacterium]